VDPNPTRHDFNIPVQPAPEQAVPDITRQIIKPEVFDASADQAEILAAGEQIAKDRTNLLAQYGVAA